MAAFGHRHWLAVVNSVMRTNPSQCSFGCDRNDDVEMKGERGEAGRAKNGAAARVIVKQAARMEST